MRILLIGGTLFLGRHVVDAALARGHDVTLFNRGLTDAGAFPNVEHVRADRDGQIAALGSRRFDAVIDTCGYVPRVVQQSAAYLASRCEFYLFVSSISAYARFTPGGDESAPLAELSDPSSEDVQRHYGALKVACERAVERHLPGRAQYARAGFIVGPYDRIPRFAYWLQRLRAGGPTLAPGEPDNPMQWIDVRDLAHWLVTSAETRRAGAFDLTGPDAHWTVGRFLHTVNATLGGHAELIWPGNERLEREELPPDAIPYWAPRRVQDLCRRALERARAAGLVFRPLEETTLQTAAHIEREGFSSENKVGVQIRTWITPEREARLLASLGSRRSAGPRKHAVGHPCLETKTAASGRRAVFRGDVAPQPLDGNEASD